MMAHSPASPPQAQGAEEPLPPPSEASAAHAEGALLFFDTFSHEVQEELNLDLVQFPSPVLVDEVRVIPLGARVQANFPGGVRLGATNPTQFQLEFFVNDLGRPGAATFERLGTMAYDQSERIHMLADRSIPTDGLVLRGMYNAITIAVYGTLSKASAEELAQEANEAQQQRQEELAEAERQARHQQQQELQRELELQEMAVAQKEQQNHHPYLSPTKDGKSPIRPPQASPPAGVEARSDRERYQQRQRSPSAKSHSSDTHWEKSSSSSHHRGVNGSSSERPPRGGSPRSSPPPRYASSPSRPNDNHASANVSASEDKKDELMDDISDISDGDIPEMEDVAAAAKEEQPSIPEPAPQQQPEEEKRSSAVRELAPAVVAAPPAPPVIPPPPAPSSNASADGRRRDSSSVDRRLSQSQSGSPSEKMLASSSSVVAAEDMEEISDEEAEWSDGDPSGFGVAKPGEVDFDFGDDWEDPVRAMDIMGVELGMPEDSEAEAHIEEPILLSLEQSLGKLAELEVSNEWIETLESATLTLSEVDVLPPTVAQDLGGKILAVSRQCLDHSSALSHALPTLKVRHIKQGLRFVKEAFRTSRVLARALLAAGLQPVLVRFLQRPHIAPTICLNALQLLDRTLDHRAGFELLAGKVSLNEVKQVLRTGEESVKSKVVFILNDKEKNNAPERTKVSPKVKKSLYPDLCRFGKKLGPCTKPSVGALLAKFSFCASVQALTDHVREMAEAEDASATDAFVERAIELLTQVTQVFQEAPSVLGQPTKLLPIRFRFQPGDCLRTDPYEGIFDIFEEAHFLDVLLALLTAPANSSALSNLCCRLLQDMLAHRRGLKLLLSHSKSTNSIVRYLLQASSSEGNHAEIDELHHSNHKDHESLALQLAFSVHCYCLLQKIRRLVSEERYSKSQLVDLLQLLYSMTLSATGKATVAQVLAEPSHLELLAQLIRSSLEVPDEEENVTLRPAIRGYACDLVKLVLRTCEDVHRLRHLAPVIARLSQEEEVAKMQEALSWTQPLVEFPNFPSSEDLPRLCAFVKKHKDNVSPMQLELITAVRMIDHFVSERHEAEHAHHRRFALINLYSQDLVQHYLEILEKICSYHEQPALHTATFVGHSGFLLLSVVKPVIKTIKCVLQNLAAARDTEFKDVSTISLLLRVFNLASVVPTSSLCYNLSREIRADVILALTAFTSPKFNLSAASSSIGSSVWTLMLKELLQFACSLPHAYLSGLQVFTQLLPLPLPLSIVSDRDATEEESKQALNTRKLWSSHLFPMEAELQKLVTQLIGVEDSVLTHALRRVMVQLSDLSPPISKMVCEAMWHQALGQAVKRPEGTNGDSNGDQHNSSNVSHSNEDSKKSADRVLSFIGWALESASIKTTTLHLLQESQECRTVLQNLCQDFSRPVATAESREMAANILQTLCDPEVTLVHPKVTNEVQLAQSVPSRAALEIIVCSGVVDHVFSSRQLDAASVLPSVRTLNLLLEHDAGFSLVRQNLERRRLGDLVEKMASLSDGPQFLAAVHAILDTLSLLCSPPPSDDIETLLFPKARSLSLSDSQLKGFLAGEKVEDEAWKLVKERVEKCNSSEEPMDQHDQSADLHLHHHHSHSPAASKEQILQQLSDLEAKHTHWLSVEAGDSKDDSVLEPHELPALSPLLELYASRQVFAVEAHPQPIGDKMTLATWTGGDMDIMEETTQHHHEEVDLLEVASSCLSSASEFELASEVRQVCDEKSLETDKQLKKMQKKKSALERKAMHNKNLISSYKAGVVGMPGMRGGRAFARSGHQRPDGFRSRPPNTSRPPSLHVDDFLVLQQRGQQPTGPTGYNKQSIKAAKELFAQREAQHHMGPGAQKSSMVGFREATKEPVYDNHAHAMRGHGPPMNMAGPRGHPFKRGMPGAGRGDLRQSGNGPMYRGGGRGGRRGWSPNPGEMVDRRFGPPRGRGHSHAPWMHDRRGGGGGPRGGDRRRFGGNIRDDGRPPRHMRTMTR